MSTSDLFQGAYGIGLLLSSSRGCHVYIHGTQGSGKSTVHKADILSIYMVNTKDMLMHSHYAGIDCIP